MLPHHVDVCDDVNHSVVNSCQWEAVMMWDAVMM